VDLGIRGKVALVVGASKGMGFAVAQMLAREGAYVVAVARGGGLLAILPCKRIAMDLMLGGAPEVLAKRLRDDGISPDIIYHAIGGSWGGIKAVGSTADEYARVWRYNLGIAIDLNNAFLPGMVAKKWGRIVHTSSDATKNSIGYAPYASAKFALEGYVKVASKEFSRHNVIISAVSPGPIYTEGRYLYSRPADETLEYFDKYLPIQRFGRAEEVAKVVSFLCSDGSAFMPGAVVDVHGGSR
jgi:3-oxoacyl-[acyl-carrier protein] reductase